MPRTRHEVDIGDTVLLVVVALARVGDFAVVGRIERPTPLALNVEVDVIMHRSESSSDAQGRFLFEYRHEGSEWALEVRARDMEDAKARLQTLPLATYMGEVVASGDIPNAGISRGNHPARPIYHGSANDN